MEGTVRGGPGRGSAGNWLASSLTGFSRGEGGRGHGRGQKGLGLRSLVGWPLTQLGDRLLGSLRKSGGARRDVTEETEYREAGGRYHGGTRDYEWLQGRGLEVMAGHPVT